MDRTSRCPHALSPHTRTSSGAHHPYGPYFLRYNRKQSGREMGKQRAARVHEQQQTPPPRVLAQINVRPSAATRIHTRLIEHTQPAHAVQFENGLGQGQQRAKALTPRMGLSCARTAPDARLTLTASPPASPGWSAAGWSAPGWPPPLPQDPGLSQEPQPHPRVPCRTGTVPGTGTHETETTHTKTHRTQLLTGQYVPFQPMCGRGNPDSTLMRVILPVYAPAAAASAVPFAALKPPTLQFDTGICMLD